jgi:uncharacterized membrane protein
MAPAAPLIALVIVALAACSDGGGAPSGVSTQSVCPPTDPPTYDNFGKTFMETYCTKCHDAAKPMGMRGDAPLGTDFDTRARLRLWTSNIDKQAAIGPAAENREMPPEGNAAPSDTERRRLGEYIACEVGQ